MIKAFQEPKESIMNSNKIFLVSILVFFFFTILVSSSPTPVSGDFVQQVSLYPTATVLSAQNLPNGTSVVLEANVPSAAVLDFYKVKMRNNGWSVLDQRQDFLAFSRQGKGVMIDVDAISREKSRVSISYLTGV